MTVSKPFWSFCAISRRRRSRKPTESFTTPFSSAVELARIGSAPGVWGGVVSTWTFSDPMTAARNIAHAIEMEATALAREPVAIVGSALATADEVATFLTERSQGTSRTSRTVRGSLELLVTDLPKSFASVAERFLGERAEGVQQIDL